MKKSIKILRYIFIISLASIFFTQQAFALTFDQVRETTTTSFTQFVETIELAFTFREEKKVQVMAKHAERRIDWAEESFDSGDTQKGQDYLDDYVQTKNKISAKLDQVDEEMVVDFQEKTIDENKMIEEFKDNLSGTNRIDIENTQTQVLEKTWEVVGEIQGEGAAENFVERIYAPGTGSGGENKVIIEGGEFKFAPGTGPGGESQVIEGTVEIKINGDGKANEGSVETQTNGQGSGNTLDTFAIDD